jgi:hypothetical protein
MTNAVIRFHWISSLVFRNSSEVTLQDWLRPILEGRRVYLGGLPNQRRSRYEKILAAAVKPEVRKLLPTKAAEAVSSLYNGSTALNERFMLADFKTQLAAKAAISVLESQELFGDKINVRLESIDSVNPTSAERNNIPLAIVGSALGPGEVAYIKHRLRQSTYTRPLEKCLKDDARTKPPHKTGKAWW